MNSMTLTRRSPPSHPAGRLGQEGVWQPLLDGVWKERALEAVGAIADRLCALPALDSGPAGRASLAEGYPGLAVLFGYLAQARPGQGHEATAGRFLGEAITAASQAPLQASLYTGLASVGWAAEHLRQQFPHLVAEAITEEVDEALREQLDSPRWSGDYDLILGLVGLGVYALERLPARAGAGVLERVIEHLAETAECRPEGATWWTNPAWLPPETRERLPRGYYNLGLAHGVPGVIALLGAACAAGVGVATARPLLEEAVRWLLAQQGPDGAGFGGWLEPEGPRPGPTRLAWCYGDPGVAAALLLAARCVGEPAWEREALAVALRSMARPPDQTGVRDAGLCHGAAGLGHLFNRLYQATGEPRLAEAARFWFRQTLELRHPDRGIAGFAALTKEREGEERWVDEPGLLTGVAGIALALLAACTPVEPAWDRVLLVSIPPKQSALGPR
jgi:lantibiotic modifying enzyme